MSYACYQRPDSARQLRTADLICIGAQKAGTTWLYRALLNHPGIFGAVFKEIHYFDSLHVAHQRNFHERRTRRSQTIIAERFERSAAHVIATFLATEILRNRTARRFVREHRFAAAMTNQTIDDKWYASLFMGARPDQITCDFTPAYALLPPSGIMHMRTLCPGAHVLYLIRDPVERALSHARMLTVRNGRPRNSAGLGEFLDSPVVTSHDDCLAVIDRWQVCWPAGRFKVVFFDDIARRPSELLHDVCAFAGVPFDRKLLQGAHRIAFKGPDIPVTEELRNMLRRRYAPLLERLRARFPEQTTRWGMPD